MKNERGIFTGPTEAAFKSEQDIKREALLADPDHKPTFNTPFPSNNGWVYWSERMAERQAKQAEVRIGEQKHVEVTFPDTVCINLIGDIHAGGSCDYDRLHREVAVITNTPNSYVLAFGDLIDGMFWNPGQMEEIEQVPEQILYANALLQHLADHNKLLVGWIGDHDGWMKKMGANMYADFAEKYGAFVMHGIGYLTMNVGEQQYKLTGAHRLPGFSQYNPNHPQKRAELMGGARGSDVIVGAHTHNKGYALHSMPEFGGGNRKVHLINLGAYKFNDDYAKKLGLSPLETEGMGGSAIVLHADQKRVEYFDDIVTANGELAKKL